MRNPSARPAARLAGICPKTGLRMVFTRSLSARASASRARSCRTASTPNAAPSGCAFAPVFYGQVSVVVAVRATPVAPVPVAAFADAIAWTVTVPAAPPGTHCAMPFWLMVAMEAEFVPIRDHPPVYGGWNVTCCGDGPVVVGSEATGAMQWFWNYWKSWGSCAGWVIRRRSGQPRPGNRSMIGEMPD